MRDVRADAAGKYLMRSASIHMERMGRCVSGNDWFVTRPQKAQAYGRLEADGFRVRKGSTTMGEGYPGVKRDRE